MAQKRMLSLKIVDTDSFLDMPPSTQLLYLHCSLRADDDGFVSNPKKIMRMIGASDDDLKILIGKQYLIPFDSGVCVIRHWRIHNLIQKDRYFPTEYQAEKSLLCGGNDRESKQPYSLLDTERIQNGNKLVPQDRVSIRVRLESGKKKSASASLGFDQFWEFYPRKENKKKAKDIWDRKNLKVYLSEILEFIPKAKETDRWKKGMIPHPTTFLNGERWNDDLKSYADSKQANSGGEVFDVKKIIAQKNGNN